MLILKCTPHLYIFYSKMNESSNPNQSHDIMDFLLMVSKIVKNMFIIIRLFG